MGLRSLSECSSGAPFPTELWPTILWKTCQGWSLHLLLIPVLASPLHMFFSHICFAYNHTQIFPTLKIKIFISFQYLTISQKHILTTNSIFSCSCHSSISLPKPVHTFSAEIVLSDRWNQFPKLLAVFQVLLGSLLSCTPHCRSSSSYWNFFLPLLLTLVATSLMGMRIYYK